VAEGKRWHNRVANGHESDFKNREHIQPSSASKRIGFAQGGHESCLEGTHGLAQGSHERCHDGGHEGCHEKDHEKHGGCDVPCDVVCRGSPEVGKACHIVAHVHVHGCPLDRVGRSGYESECNVGVEGKCVSGGVGRWSGWLERVSVGMWFAPIDQVKVKGEWELGPVIREVARGSRRQGTSSDDNSLCRTSIANFSEVVVEPYRWLPREG
jgi:hypothetical protein